MSVSCLLLGSDAVLPEGLAAALAADGYATEAVAEPDAFRSKVRSGRYAMGFLRHAWPSEPCVLIALRDLRRESAIPCIVVGAARVPPGQRVAALDAGADEVLDPAVSVPEAVARVRAILRRAASRAAPAPAEAGWRLSAESRQVDAPDGRSHRLTSAEFDLLRLLVAASGEAVDRDAVSRHVLRRPWNPADRAVDGLVKRLRRKLGADAIRSARGVGYALTVRFRSG